MKKNKIKKFNIVDVVAMVTILLFGVLVVAIARRPERDLGQPALLTIKANNTTEAVCAEAGKKGIVYLNGVDIPAAVKESACSNGILTVEIEGRGTEKEELMTFNGQRVLIGQKAELHGSFWVQGVITGFELQ